MEALTDVLSHEFLESAALLESPLLGLAQEVVRQVQGRFHQLKAAENQFTGEPASWVAR
jgi:hypothetical protein